METINNNIEIEVTFSLDKKIKINKDEIDYNDLEDKDLKSLYMEQHESIEELLIEFSNLLDKNINVLLKNIKRNGVSSEKYKDLQKMMYLKKECQDWHTSIYELDVNNS